MKFPVLCLYFSLAKCGRLGVMFLKRLVVCEATYAKQPQVKKEPCRVLDNVDIHIADSVVLLGEKFCVNFISSEQFTVEN